jgi:ferredoxin
MVTRDVVRIDETKCDGCGLCVGACAEGAISVERVEVAPFDEVAVASRLRPVAPAAAKPAGGFSACPGSRPVSFAAPASPRGTDIAGQPSALRH